MKYKISILIVFTIILLFLITFFIPSLKCDSSENRTMATFDMVLHPMEDSVVYYDSPVERLNAALSDQFPFRETVVKKYLKVFNVFDNLTSTIGDLFTKRAEHQYSLQAIGNYGLIENTNYITPYPSTELMNEEFVARRISQIETIHQKYPDIKIYVYFVSQAFDTSWFNDYIGARTADHFQQIKDSLPEYVKADHLEYLDLNDYMEVHYQTDHHWNHRGARRGYENIYSMMRDDYELGRICTPQAEINLSQMYDFVYLGSYGRALGELYDGGYDEFVFYDYGLPRRYVAILDPVTRMEIEAEKIGLYDEYLDGEIDKTVGMDHYINMYGTAKDKEGNVYSDGTSIYIIRNGKGNSNNLLLCGDSYNRALRDVLASHFDTMVYMDYRNFSKIPLDYVIETYDINALLISSHDALWNYEEYYFTFKEGE